MNPFDTFKVHPEQPSTKVRGSAESSRTKPTERSRRMKRMQVCLYATFIIFAINQSIGYAIDDAKKAEELMVTEKKIEEEKEKALIEHFYNEGKRLIEEGSYAGAIEQFARILEIDPKHRKAKSGIKKAKQKMRKEKIEASPKAMARKLLKSGRKKYAGKDFDEAIEDFQAALVLDYTNKDVLEWIKRARRRKGLEEAEQRKRDIVRETEVATGRKEAHEKLAMLEVEKAYLPPEKPERRPVEIEELVSPEEAMEEKARQELLKKLKKKMVPAVSLTDADIRDVIRQLMEITNVTIVIDEGALAKAAGVQPLRLTFSTVNPMPLLAVLDIALRATELDYRIEPNYIWISTPEKLEQENLVTKTYRLRYGVRRIRKVELKEFETKTSESSD